MTNTASLSLEHLSNCPTSCHLTLGIILDALEPYHIVHKPEGASAQKDYRWFCCEGCREIPSRVFELPDEADPRQVVFLCTLEGFFTLRQKDEDSLAVVLLSEPDDSSSLDERSIGLATDRPLVYLYLILKEKIGLIARWEQTLSDLVRDGKGIEEVLDASSELIPNYLFIYDNNNYVRAQSTTIEPPDDYHRAIALSGFTSGCGRRAAKHLLSEERTAVEEDPDTGSVRLVHHLTHERSYVGTVSMATLPTPLTSGLADLFDILVSYLKPMCADLRNKTSINIPRLHFLSRLLAGNRFDRMVIKSQLESLHIPADSWFKLFLVEINEGLEPAKASHIAMTFITEKRMNARCFLHDGQLLVLQFGANGPELAHLTTERILSSYEYTRFDTAYGISDVFHDISYLKYAYHEAQLALDMRRCIMAQRNLEPASKRRNRAFFFYEAFPFYLVDAAPKDEQFMNFVFSTSFIPALLEEDHKKDTNDFNLLWTYLLYERNVTKTATALFTHRNTVLYRINRIQEKFRVDLNDSCIREKICADYRLYFLTTQNLID